MMEADLVVDRVVAEKTDEQVGQLRGSDITELLLMRRVFFAFLKGATQYLVAFEGCVAPARWISVGSVSKEQVQ